MQTRLGQLSVRYSSRGIPNYSLELWHDGLKKHRLIRGESKSIIKLKADLQISEWDDRWVVVFDKEQERKHKAADKRQKDERKALAVEQTAEAQKELERLSLILKATLSVDDAINWESLKDKAPFHEEKPILVPELPLPDEPIISDAKYKPLLNIFDKIISSRKARKIIEMQVLYQSDHKDWKNQVSSIRRKSQADKLAYEMQLAEWNKRKDEYHANKLEEYAFVDAKRAAYESKNPDAIVEYCDLVLSSSIYPDYFPQEFDIDFDQSSKTVIVDYKFPAPDDLPLLKSVKYVAARDEFEEQYLTEAQSAKLYDEVLYQVVLRTVHELFEADTISEIEVVVFNGIVSSIDRTTGKLVTACILSLRANRSEFLEINLDKIEPKACFKSLKGVGSSKLHGLSPVPPIMQLNREDGRFVSAYEVANNLDESVNLASIGWEDFEHLIREVFEKEFSSSGGEVKVTQASRDGGVDAVVYDPDPIRGGKIVIQAKRYTNTVGVGAVRDLYGTVLNEGASKGILVTTSDYGPDSYTFANGKPLVLLSGSNLLHMLEKHGHRARIDLKEAKKLAANS